MAKTITIVVRDVYGKPCVYPVCAAAKTFAQIAGTKTLSHATLIAIESLGYEIVEAAPRPSLSAWKRLHGEGSF
jgi:hypothetical protein